MFSIIIIGMFLAMPFIWASIQILTLKSPDKLSVFSSYFIGFNIFGFSLFNALAYLADENGVITSRKKEITLRPLDRVKIQQAKTYWQLLNMIAPLAALLCFGLIRGYWRKRTYAR